MPSAIASSLRSSSIASCERPLSAIASSRLSGNASSTAIDWSPAATASSPRPDHHNRRDSQRRSSPTRSASPAASWIASRARRASIARSEVPAEVGLDRDALERLDADGRVGALLGGERRLPVLERLAVAARAARGAGGRRGEAADRVDLARAARVVGEAGGIGVAGRRERAEDQAVELAAADGGEVVLDGAAGEVVAEGDACRRGA